MTTHRTITGDWYVLVQPNGELVQAIDGKCTVYMLIDNPRDAILEAARQNKMYDLNCRPMRLADVTSKENTDE